MDQQERILKVLNKTTGKQLNPGPEESLFVSGMLDSFALTDFVTGLEEEFKIRIPDSDLSARKFDTVTKVAAYIAAKS